MRSLIPIAVLLAAASQTLAVPAGTPTSSAPTQTATGVEEASAAPQLGNPHAQGCFGSYGNLTFHSSEIYNSKSRCVVEICIPLQKNVAATHGNNCYCGDYYPPMNLVVPDTECHLFCPGYPQEACGGGSDLFTVYNTGLDVNVQYMPNATVSNLPSNSPSSTSSSDSTTTVTQTNSADTSGGSSGGTNVAGIAAGVVVGIVALGAIFGTAFYCLRRRRNQELEEEHRRNAAVNAFFSGTKPPSSSGGVSITDSRLDPVMAQRRLSDGSIADNQDYSRRILRVTNA